MTRARKYHAVAPILQDVSHACENGHLQKPVLLLSDAGYEYYKVPVKHGERLVEGKVPETCEAAGLKAVCTGPDDGCKFTDTSKCMVTPLSNDYGCGRPMYPLS